MLSFRHPILLLALVVASTSGRATAQQTIPLDALLRGSRIHYSEGRYERALETLERAYDQHGSTADPAGLAEIHIWLGLSRAQLRRFEPAGTNFLTALELYEGTLERLREDEQWRHWSWTSLFSSARDLYARGQPDSALPRALAATRIDGARPGAFQLVASSYSALGRYDDMLLTAREMLETDPEDPEALSLVGLYFLQKPDSLWSEEMLVARWDSCGYYYERAISTYEDRYEEAQRSLGDVLGIPPGPELDEVTEELVELSRLPDQEPLRAYIEDELGAARQIAEVAHYGLALFYASGNLNDASSRAGSALLRAAAEVGDERAEEFRNRARNLFTKALEYNPDDYTAMYNLGLVHYQAQEDSLAEATFRRVLEATVAPVTDLPEQVQAELNAVGLETGYTQLEPALMRVVDEAVEDLDYTTRGFAWLYAQEQGLFVSIQPPAALEGIYLLTGVTQTSIGLAREREARGSGREKLEQAIGNLKMVLGIDPDNPEAWQNLVHCYRETGQTSKALEAAERYQQLTGGRRP